MYVPYKQICHQFATPTNVGEDFVPYDQFQRPIAFVNSASDLTKQDTLG